MDRPLLAFDCSGAACSAAVAREGAVLAHCFESRPRGHGERLLPMAAEVLRQAGCGYGDLAAFAVTLGPGSFTGLRVGLATARALGLATGLPVVGRSCFEVLAAAALPELQSGERLLVAIDSQRGDLFVQDFSTDGAATSEPISASPQTAAAGRRGDALLLAGSGADRLAEALAQGGARCRTAAAALLADAAVLARLASLGPLPPPGSPPPAALYLRPADTTQPARTP